MSFNTKDLAILLPGYQKNNGGNITMAYQFHEKIPRIIRHPISHVIHLLRQEGHNHFIFSANRMQIWTNHNKLLPLFVDINTIFFPLHFRKAPQNTHDGCTAYLRLSIAFSSELIAKPTHPRDKVIFKLPSGVVFSAAANWETFWRHATEARQVKNELLIDNCCRLNQLSAMLTKPPDEKPLLPITPYDPKTDSFH